MVNRTTNNATTLLSRWRRWGRALIASPLAAVAMRDIVRVESNMLRGRDRPAIYTQAKIMRWCGEWFECGCSGKQLDLASLI